MLAAHAIIYMNDDAAGATALSIRRSIAGEQKERHDIGLCDLQKERPVFASLQPFFTQSAELQGRAKRDRRAEQEDFISMPREAGDVVAGPAGPLTVIRNRYNGLEFLDMQKPAP